MKKGADLTCNKGSDLRHTSRPPMFRYFRGPRVIEVNKTSHQALPMDNAIVTLLLTLDGSLNRVRNILTHRVSEVQAIVNDRECAISRFERSVADKGDRGPGGYYEEGIFMHEV
jgi:hypothetical protein